MIDLTYPRVAVVIPTSGRATLQRAVQSALAQEDVDVHVYVLTAAPSIDLEDSNKVEVIKVSGQPNANALRQAGIEHAAEDLVALLDDDDWWHPRKLKTQWATVVRTQNARDGRWICSSRLTLVPPSREMKVLSSSEWSTKDATIGDYLFRRRSIRDDHPYLQSSSFLFPRSVGLELPWSSTVERHQDWTWLIRAHADGVALIQSNEQLVYYSLSSPGSLSRATDPLVSEKWGRDFLGNYERPSIVGEFMLRVPFNMCIQDGNVLQAMRLLWIAAFRYHAGAPAQVRSLLVLLRESMRRTPAEDRHSQ